jgi:hypothetical protein
VDAAAWDARYAEQELVWSAGPNRFVEEQVGDLTPGRALDHIRRGNLDIAIPAERLSDRPDDDHRQAYLSDAKELHLDTVEGAVFVLPVGERGFTRGKLANRRKESVGVRLRKTSLGKKP